MPLVVHPDKIAKYLLDPTSRVGAAKARFFMARGFSPERSDELAAALRQHAAEAALRRNERHPEGRKLIYECSLHAPDGSHPCIRSVWIEADDGSYCRLISAYPADYRARPVLAPSWRMLEKALALG